MTTSAELAYLFRALKAPAAARALPKLAERARQEEWSYERFAEVLLQTEQASRDPPGTGKSHLAIALSIRACLQGQRVLFATATEWVARLGDAQRHGRLADELRKLERIPLVVVDEVGYIPFDPQAANLMFMLVSSRYERASLIVTSNKPFSAWGEIFGDEVVAAAMIDRLVHHAEILSLKGDSYRLKDKDLGARPQPRE